jgi:2',3'-cyclic-nucleotide 2'-phosphodiesterase (5'-nucleotidase family)
MKIKRYSISLPLLLVFLFLGCSSNTPAKNRFTTLTIYHTNDVHSHLIPNNLKRGGLAYLASVLREVSEKEPESLILDAGDMYKKGHLPARKTKDEFMADLLSQMPYYDARAVGNNEVKVGIDKLLIWSQTKERSRSGGKTPLLSSNFVDKNGKTVFQPYIIVKKSGLKIGLVGLTYEGTFNETEGTNIQNASDPRAPYSIKQDEETLTPIIKELRPKVDILILISHEIFKRNKILAKQFPQIDLFICGHSHNLTPAQSSHGQPILVESGEFGQQIGVVTLVYDHFAHKVFSENSKFWPIGPDFQSADPNIDSSIKAAYLKYAPEASEKIGTLKETLSLLSAATPFEGSLHDWVADVMKLSVKADVAIVNRDMLREDLIKGPITKEDLYLSAPYEDKIAFVKLTSKKLEAMIRSAMILEYHKIGVMPFAFSGIKASVNVDNEKDELTKVDIKFDSQKQDLSVAFPAFMLKNCEKYFNQKFCPIQTISASGNVAQLLADYVKNNPVVEVPEGERIVPVFKKDIVKSSDEEQD